MGQANYATAKAGVVGLTKAVAKEWGPCNIRCNALVFGYIATRWVGVVGGACRQARAARMQRQRPRFALFARRAPRLAGR